MTEAQQTLPDPRLSEGTIRRMVKDLVSKYPKGPHGLLKPQQYRPHRSWSDKRRRDVDFMAIGTEWAAHSWLRLTAENVPHYGYTAQQLYMLITDNGNEPNGDDDAALKIVKRACGVNGPAATRRANLLHIRTRQACRQIRDHGMQGLWRVSTYRAEYGTLWRDMTMWGVNRADVESRVRLIGPMTGLDPEWPIEVKFSRHGTPDDATSSAIRSATARQRRLEEEISDLERRLETRRRELETEKLNTVRSMGGIMLLTQNSDTEEEAAQ